MTPFTTLTGIAAPLPLPNIDTEVMIRISRLMEFGKGALGPYLFEPLRYDADGAENPDFTLNRPAFRASSILIGGENFGCGSSREAAVWALHDFGVRCIIAPSFGDIFAANCLQNGLLTIRLPADEVAALAAEIAMDDPQPFTVDLEAQTITPPSGRTVGFSVDPVHRTALLKGLDEIDQTRQLDAEIDAHQHARDAAFPWANGSLDRSVPRVLIMAGDGVGPEAMDEVKRVIDWFVTNRGLRLDLHEELYGISAWKAHGAVVRPEAWALIDQADAILFGASGSPDYDAIPRHHWLPDNLLKMRSRLDLFDNQRPVRTFAGLEAMSSLRPEIIEGADIVIVRELTAGLYFSDPRGIETLDDGRRRGTNSMTYTSDRVERIGRSAFELARRRSGRLCSVDKANVLEVSMLWRDEIEKLHADYPDVDLSHMYVDNCAMQLVRNPRQFDVIVTENLFGDILSDCAAMVAGSIGMLPSASIGPVDVTGRRQALYEPIHGSAPDIAGRGICNPIGSILSFGMCLEQSFGLPDEAKLLDRAVQRAIDGGARTADIAGGLPAITTRAMGDAVLRALDAIHLETTPALVAAD